MSNTWNAQQEDAAQEAASAAGGAYLETLSTTDFMSITPLQWKTFILTVGRAWDAGRKSYISGELDDEIPF